MLSEKIEVTLNSKDIGRQILEHALTQGIIERHPRLLPKECHCIVKEHLCHPSRYESVALHIGISVDRLLEHIAELYLDPSMQLNTLHQTICGWWRPYLDEDMEPVLSALNALPGTTVSGTGIVPAVPPQGSRRWKNLLTEFALHSGHHAPQYKTVPVRQGDIHAFAVEVSVRNQEGQILGHDSAYGSGANVNMAKLRASENYVKLLRSLGFQL